MANYNNETGKWDSVTGSSFDNRGQADAHDRMMGNRGGGNSNYGFGNAMLAALWKFICLIPRLLGLAIGGLCGLILKLGITGKVILSALAAAGTLIILAVIATEIITSDNAVIETIVGIIEIVAALAVGAWFWLFHYKVVEQIPYRNFVALTTQCMMICFWGAIILGIISVVFKLSLGFGGSIGIALAAAIVWWLWKAKTCASDAVNEKTDFEKTLKMAEEGDTQAMLSVAGAYFDGDHVKQDKAKGLEWYTKAAQSGNNVAQYNLGVLYYDGDGVKKDRKKAFEWYRKAAENGHAEAQYCLYVAYAAPDPADGIEQDLPTAMEWLKKSAAQGFKEAQDDLAEMGNTAE
jgi:hypothetical protein